MLLEGMRALVTGGTSGIGAAIVERLARDGARVVLTGRDAARGEAVARRTGARFVAADARDPDAVEVSVATAREALGGLDAVVCNAGAIVDGPLVETPPCDWQALLDVNLGAPYRYSLACLPALRDAGGGAIVHVASDAAVWGEPAIGAYSVTKAALVMLAQMLAVEAGPDGVRVNAVCPGDTAPGMVTTARGRDESRADAQAAGWLTPPLGRVGQAADVAGAVAFLLGPDAAFVNGVALLVDGGMRAAQGAWRQA